MKLPLVTGPKFKDYFKFYHQYRDPLYNLQYNIQLFNPFVLSLISAVVFLVIGFFKPIFWAFAAGLVALKLFLYYKAKNLAHGIRIERRVVKMAREKDTVEVFYSFWNYTGFKLDLMDIDEKFEGVLKGHYFVKLDQGLGAQTKVETSKKITLDNGMGVKKFGDIEIVVYDELGIFPFKINFQNSESIEVFPFIENIPFLKNKVSTDSIDFGLYEISKRGDSNLFKGTREYRSGDAVKLINWKLSLKGQGLVVNEFEKSTNTYITILLDLDYDNQLGMGANSTWEAAKDIALGLVAKEINRFNSVQVIAHDLYIPFGNSSDHLALIERHFTFHEMSSSKNSDHFKHLHRIPAEGQVYYFCPLLLTPKIQETFGVLKKLRLLNHEITIVVLDPYKSVLQGLKGEMRSTVLTVERSTRENFESQRKHLVELK